MAIKLLAFDLDGTTIRENRYLSPKNKEALTAAGEKGVALVPATGRMMSFIPKEILDIPYINYAVTSNGAAVYDIKKGKPLFEHLIPNEDAARVQKILNDYDVYIEYYKDGRAIVKRGFPEAIYSRFNMPASKARLMEKDYIFIDCYDELVNKTGICPEKINLPYLEPGLKTEIHERLKNEGVFNLSSSIDDNIEINWNTADKGKALKELTEMLGFKQDEVFAIGDNGNDVSMLKYAGCSVAVEDGAEEAREAAKYIICAHDKDGLAQAIYKFVLP